MALEAGLWWLVSIGIWMCTITMFSMQELMAAGLGSVPAAAGAVWARRALGTHWRPSRAALRPLRAIPATLITDSWQLLVFAIGRESRTVERRVDVADDDLTRAFAGFWLSLVPASYVVDVDERGFRLHALTERRSTVEESIS